MPRPRSHDLDDLLDAAERIVTDAGTAGLTLRALAEAAGVSNGSIYHAFSSKEELLGRAWLRAARRLFAVQRAMSDAVPADAAVERVVATALAPLSFATDCPSSARMFFAQRRDQLFSDSLSGAIVDELVGIQIDFNHLLADLATGVWARHDGIAIDGVACCVVDLPSGMLRRQLLNDTPINPRTAERLRAAVHAVLDLPLPAPRRSRPTTRKDRS